MVSIQNYLYGVFLDFRKYVDTGDKLCALKSLRFDSGNLPDYSNPHVQQLYLLRYTYGYAFEYKRMYESLMERIPPEQPLEVLSIGCGNLVDYWALARVAGDQRPIRYLGIDIMDWSWRFFHRPQDDTRFQNIGFKEYLQNTPELTADVYTFPKSISEFTNEEFTEICSLIETKKIQKNTVHFLFSLRTDEGSLQWDTERTAQLYNTLCRMGFASQDAPENTCSLPEETQQEKISSLDPEFAYPQRIQRYLTSLHFRCAGYQEKGACCQPECKTLLDHWPVLRCKKMLWRIYTFERKGDQA